jgi:effector-binding domain-containing protein
VLGIEAKLVREAGALPRRIVKSGEDRPMLHARTGLVAALLLVVSTLAHGQAPAQNEPAPAPPAPAQTEAPPAAGQPSQSPDAFGEEVTLAGKTIIYMSGNATWDSAFETLIDAFKQLNTYVDRQGLKPDGSSMTIYTSTDDTGFSFQAAIPLAEEPKNPPRGDLAVGKSPSGRALKFVHRGSYDSMDTTYEAITNHLDEKRLEAKDLFIEEYATDPVSTPEDQLVITVLVPVR